MPPQPHSGQIIIPNLINGTKYYVRLKGKNRVKHSNWSSPPIQVTPRGKPPKPTITAIGGNGIATITVSLEDGGFPITNYKYALNGASEYTIAPVGNPFTLTGLTEGDYTIRVISVNSAGDSPPSEPASFTTGSPPTKPTITATPGIGSVTVEVTTISTFPNTGYNYEYSSTSGTIQGSASSNPFTLNDLTRGTVYTIRVQAVNSVGTSPFSDQVSFTTPNLPGTASIGTLSIGGKGSIVVPFTHGAPNGSPITGAIIQYSTSSSFPTSSVNTININDTSTSYTITGLVDDTTYYMRVASVNALGTGVFSSSKNLRTGTRPSAPTNVILKYQFGKMACSFTAPTNPPNSPIKGYIYNLIGVDTSNTVTRTNTETEFTISAPFNKSYVLKVRAYNDIGQSPWSVGSNSFYFKFIA